jgi:hypothetical protein
MTAGCPARNASPSCSVQVAVHHLQDLRKRDQRLDAGVPGLLPERRGQLIALEGGVGRLLQPSIGFDDFQRIGRGDQDLTDQRVRIERDRRGQLIELFRRQRRGGLIGRRSLTGRRGRRLVLRRRQRAEQHDGQSARERG